jgi:hypothetical protein
VQSARLNNHEPWLYLGNRSRTVADSHEQPDGRSAGASQDAAGLTAARTVIGWHYWTLSSSVSAESLSGFCPGPAVMNACVSNRDANAFVSTMLIAILVFFTWDRRNERHRSTPRSDRHTSDFQRARLAV